MNQPWFFHATSFVPMRLATTFLSLALTALALLPTFAATYGAHLGAVPAVVTAPQQLPSQVATIAHTTARLVWARGARPTGLDNPLATWTPGSPIPGMAAFLAPASPATFTAPSLHAALAATLPAPTQTGAPSLSVFPNPARGLLTVQLSAQHGPDYKLRLSNVLGREVRLLPLPLAAAATGLPLDVTGLPAGLYFCSLLVNDKAVSTNRLTLL
ncbi:T9SS type A sorting domain-containing protein [Hymenobacter sp. H14-R3]|uniref:T9SS type A sorting domain-containing protein n=1 Tax=Hymenobacter sp. H14-R3 TaxID=3046308 RepID=UPI0024BB0180|nr:T9SS type A sorting domain-containing protein [Hymenobacter sp. H14-R3]MDJ0365117.1 T9SS type A sorting domain-containing protein [Hymenobacter sp. H14-R3]